MNFYENLSLVWNGGGTAAGDRLALAQQHCSPARPDSPLQRQFSLQRRRAIWLQTDALLSLKGITFALDHLTSKKNEAVALFVILAS